MAAPVGRTLRRRRSRCTRHRQKAERIATDGRARRPALRGAALLAAAGGRRADHHTARIGVRTAVISASLAEQLASASGKTIAVPKMTAPERILIRRTCPTGRALARPSPFTAVRRGSAGARRHGGTRFKGGGGYPAPRDSRSTSLKYAHHLHPFLITLVVLIPGWSWAADIHVTRIDVEKHRFATITIIGEIDQGDVARFKEILDRLRSWSYNDVIEVEVNSRGGKVIPAMEIGTIIRDNWLWTSLADDTGAVC
jgi:hypothetical protein